MPDRLRKDLANAKALARLLEDQYRTLRTRKAEQIPKNGDVSKDAANGAGEPDQDVPMSENVIDEEDPEPREMGSEAVERRAQKLVDDMREQGVFDGLDENATELKQVRSRILQLLKRSDSFTWTNRPWSRWICIWHIFVLHSTHAITARA